MQRRRLLQLGLVSATVLAVAGGSLALLQPGLRGGKLTDAGRTVLAAVARAVLDGVLPADRLAQATTMQALLARIDALVTGLPAHAQSELSQLLTLLAAAPGRTGLAMLSSPWEGASVHELQQALQAMRTSRFALRRQAYQALHDITGGAYFSEPATWTALGYPGPIRL